MYPAKLPIRILFVFVVVYRLQVAIVFPTNLFSYPAVGVHVGAAFVIPDVFENSTTK